MLSMLGDDDRRDLLELGRPRRYPRGRVIFAEGDQSDHVVVVTEGTVKVFCTTADGREPLLALRGPGDTIGELAAIDEPGGGRGATVVAVSAVVAREIGGRQFRAYLESHPGAAMVMLRTLTARLRGADRRRVEFGGYDTVHRLSRLLVELADEHGVPDPSSTAVEVPFSQHELAAMIGSSRESVSRALVGLRDHGLVESRRRGVALLDVAGMRRRAG